uniref:Uncharacterized protein n=1 Tax=Strongyloides stercoralis TaxID=6248 RepID=A0A0K0E038_STRER
MKQLFVIYFITYISIFLEVSSLSCNNNCYSYDIQSKHHEKWCEKHNLPLSGVCEINDMEGCISGHIEIYNKTIYYQTCTNTTPVNFDFSNGGNCTEYSNYEEDNNLYFPSKNGTRERMKFKACKCYDNMCNIEF